MMMACSSGQGNAPSPSSSLFSFDVVDMPALQTAMQQQWSDTVFVAALGVEGVSLSAVYKQNKYQSFWLNKEGLLPCAKGWLASLESLHDDGLALDSNGFSTLDSLLAQARENDALDDMQFVTALETQLSQSYFQTAKRLMVGSVDSVGIPKKYWHPPTDSVNAQAWFAYAPWSDSLGLVQALRPQHPWYNRLRNEYHRVDSLSKYYTMPSSAEWFTTDSLGNRSASLALYTLLDARLGNIPDSLRRNDTASFKKLVAQFQFRYGLKVNGKIDSLTERMLQWPFEEQKKSLALNMERFRWFRNAYQQPFVWVNIPQMNLTVFLEDTPVFYMRTVVGRPSRPTPVIDAAMKQVVVSPPWTVPPTILEKDVLPGILRRGGGYLARKGLRAVDGNGKPIDPSIITLANYKRFSYTQKPGYNSSLGEIKFNMPNSESVYMHDTPHREDFPKANRALSSGCVRVHKPKAFATFVLNDTGKYSYTKIDSMCKERKTKYIPIGKPMQVYFAYLTAGVDSTGHFVYPADIYSWDPYRP
jgi:murein L,D-transpeptidase YcbB/YkuD